MKRDRVPPGGEPPSTEPVKPEVPVPETRPLVPHPEPRLEFSLPQLMAITPGQLDRPVWKQLAELAFPGDGVELRQHNERLDHNLATVLASPFARSIRNERAKRIINERGEKIREAQLAARKACGIDKWPFPLNRFEREEQKARFDELVSSGAFPVEKRHLQWPLLDSIDIMLIDGDDPRQEWFDRALAIWNRHTHSLPPELQRDLLVNRVRSLDQELTRYFRVAQYNEGPAFIEQFRQQLFNFVVTLRERMRAPSPRDEIKRCIAALQRHCWNSFEIDLAMSLMKDERIELVDFYEIKLSNHTSISRADIKQKCRPSAAISDRLWEANFTSSAAIQRAEAELVREQAAARNSGRGPLDDAGRPYHR